MSKKIKNFTNFRPKKIQDKHMPKNFDISLKSYGGGGSAKNLNPIPNKLKPQNMEGFESKYANIIDYIVKITFTIWEKKNIGYIYDTYSHDCIVWDEIGLQYGSEKIVSDTVHTNNAFPDIRLFAEEVIWAGDDKIGYHTSHRTIITGTNTGYSKFSAPTGNKVRLFCIANCVAKNNEIFYENVVYDTAGLIKQLGLSINDIARQVSKEIKDGDFTAITDKKNFNRNIKKIKEYKLPDLSKNINVRDFVYLSFDQIWNRRNFSLIQEIYSENVDFEGSTMRKFKGVHKLKDFIISLIACFPDLALNIEDLYWMGNQKDGYLISIRWAALGTHKGNGMYGQPTNKKCQLWGITQWEIKNNQIIKEWTGFNEFAIHVQLLR